jgi:hypothetical protein
MDRKGNVWKMPGEDNGKYLSPFEAVGFAEGGNSIIAHDGKCLFVIPTSTIKIPENTASINGR